MPGGGGGGGGESIVEGEGGGGEGGGRGGGRPPRGSREGGSEAAARDLSSCISWLMQFHRLPPLRLLRAVVVVAVPGSLSHPLPSIPPPSSAPHPPARPPCHPSEAPTGPVAGPTSSSVPPSSPVRSSLCGRRKLTRALRSPGPDRSARCSTGPGRRPIPTASCRATRSVASRRGPCRQPSHTGAQFRPRHP